MKLIKLKTPISLEEIKKLKVGDLVSLSGIFVTGRDVAHKYMMDKFIKSSPEGKDKALFDKLLGYLKEGVIYHCGPVVKKEGDKYKFIAAGPTTSIREEPYQADVIKCFNLRGVVGKGGMGDKTLKACKEHKAVYLHSVGGAAVLIAKSIKEVIEVECLDFGTPEAFWVIRVEDFMSVVTMDSNGESLHDKIKEKSKSALDALLKK